MSVRLISACLAALAGALTFCWVWSLPEWGLVFGLMGWIFWDAWRAVCLLRWLRQGDFTREAPTLPGIWGYLVAWLRKTVDLSQREAQSWKQQHQAFLSAIQASPNGVVLLDPQGRIDWVNDTAAAHFGLDPLRDRGQFVGHLIRDPVLTQLFAEIGASRRVDASPAEVLSSHTLRYRRDPARWGAVAHKDHASGRVDYQLAWVRGAARALRSRQAPGRSAPSPQPTSSTRVPGSTMSATSRRSTRAAVVAITSLISRRPLLSDRVHARRIRGSLGSSP